MSHAGGAVLRGDTLEYTINVINSGFDTSTGVVLNDVLPAGVTFVPGSIRVTAGANAGAKTDAGADDQGEYISASRTVRVRLGTGATAAAGGSARAGVSTTVAFRVTVDAATLGTVSNQATVTGGGPVRLAGAGLPDGRQRAAGRGVQTTDVFVEQCAQSSDCSGATPLCLGSVSPRICVACLSDANCSGTTPICNTGTHTCQPCASDAAVSGERARLPGVGRLRRLLGDEHRRLLRRGDADLRHPRARLRAVSVERALLGRDAGLQHGTKACVGCLANADCGGSTPICDPAFLICRACGGDSECGGATPACQPGGRVRPVLGGQRGRVHGRDAGVRGRIGHLRALRGQRGLLGRDADLRRRHAHLPRLRRRRRVRGRDAGVPGRAARAGSARRRNASAVWRRDAGLLHDRRDVRAVRRRTRSAAGRRRCATRRRTPAGRARATASAAARRRRVRGAARAGSARRQRERVRRRDAGLLRGDGDVRAVSVERAVRRRRRRCATRRRTPAGRARATASAAARRRRASRAARAGSARRPTPRACGGRDAGLLHDDGDVRAVHVERAVRRARRRSATSATHTCRACGGDSECGGATPACQPGGACGVCSATNATLCTGATPVCFTPRRRACRAVERAVRGTTPVCNTATHTCRACAGDGECGGATPACQGAARAAQCSATNATACSGATPVCFAPAGDLRPCLSNAQCGGTTPVCNTATHTCRACARRRRVRRRDAGVPAGRRVRPVLGDQRHALRRRDAGLLHAPTGTCVPCVSNAQCGGATPICNLSTHTCRACGGDSECGGATPACQPGGACGQCSATNASRLRGRDAGLLAATGDLRAVHVERAVRRDDAGVQHRDAHLPRLRGRRRVRRRDAGVPGERRVRPVLGDERDRVPGATPVCFAAARDLRAVPVERAVRRRDAGVQHRDAHLPRLRGRRRVRRRDAGLPAGRRVRPVLGDQRRRCGGATPVCYTAGGTCVPCVPNAQCGGATPVCDAATHTCRACAGDSDCGGATPACQPGGACGVCSATNATLLHRARRRSATSPPATACRARRTRSAAGTAPVCNPRRTPAGRARATANAAARRRPASRAARAASARWATRASARARRPSATRRRARACRASPTPTARARRRSAIPRPTAAAPAPATASAAARRRRVSRAAPAASAPRATPCAARARRRCA